ncbi:MAG: Ig-like domain-containing protein [Gemmatimonadaceae bacterium]
MQRYRLSPFVIGAIALSACSNESMMSPSGRLDVLSVSPAAASSGVSVASSIAVTFSRPMMVGMEARVLLHEGDVRGPTVAGAASWSADRMTLTFKPTAALKARMAYVLHLAGDMRGSDGSALDHQGCSDRGGMTVTAGMMDGGAMGNMMGNGWRGADGAYGMVFTFTTG